MPYSFTRNANSTPKLQRSGASSSKRPVVPVVDNSVPDVAPVNEEDARAKMRQDIQRRLATINARAAREQQQQQQQQAVPANPTEYRGAQAHVVSTPSRQQMGNNISHASTNNTTNPFEYEQDINPRDVYYKQVRSKLNTFRSSSPAAFKVRSPHSKKSFTTMGAYHQNVRSGSIERVTEEVPVAPKWHDDPLRAIGQVSTALWVDAKEEMFAGKTPRSVLLRAEAVQNRSSSVNNCRRRPVAVAAAGQPRIRSQSAGADRKKEIPEANERVKQLAVPIVHSLNRKVVSRAAQPKRQHLVEQRTLAPHPSGVRPLQARHHADPAAHPTPEPIAAVPLATPQQRRQTGGGAAPKQWSAPFVAPVAAAAPRAVEKNAEATVDLDTSGDTPVRGQLSTPPESPYQALSPPSEARPPAPSHTVRVEVDSTPSSASREVPKQVPQIPFNLPMDSSRISRPDLFQGHSSASPSSGPYAFRNQQVDSASRELLFQMQRR